jgi:hypothetical protein
MEGLNDGGGGGGREFRRREKKQFFSFASFATSLITLVLHGLYFDCRLCFVVANFNTAFERVSGCMPVPEIIDPVFAKTSQNARFLLSENERFGLVFVKTGSINSGTGGNAKGLISFALERSAGMVLKCSLCFEMSFRALKECARTTRLQTFW